MSLIVKQLIEVGRLIAAAHLVQGQGGNVSGRYREQIAISRSGADLGKLKAYDFVLIPTESPLPNPGALYPRPSSEWAMHQAIYAARPETRVVLHAHAPKAISLGLAGRSLPASTPDFYLHLGAVVPLLPYITPTTEELAVAAGDLMKSAKAVLLQNHGVVVAGPNAREALLRLQLLEEQAGIYLDALAAGQPHLLSFEDREGLDKVTGGRYQAGRLP